MRTVVTFHSAAFNTTEEKPYFINPGCFGDDLAQWLVGELRHEGLETDDKPDQEDFGWYFNFENKGVRSTLVIGFGYPPLDRPADGTWIGWIERRRGFLGSLLGGRGRDIDPSAIELIHAILSASPQIRDVRWYFRKDFDIGNWAIGSPTP
jgi:hypothetical protein